MRVVKYLKYKKFKAKFAYLLQKALFAKGCEIEVMLGESVVLSSQSSVMRKVFNTKKA